MTALDGLDGLTRAELLVLCRHLKLRVMASTVAFARWTVATERAREAHEEFHATLKGETAALERWRAATAAADGARAESRAYEHYLAARQAVERERRRVERLEHAADERWREYERASESERKP